MRGALLCVLGYAAAIPAGSAATVESLIESAGNAAVDNAWRAVKDVREVAEELRARCGGVDSTGNESCMDQELTQGQCEAVGEEFRKEQVRSKLRQARDVYRGVLADTNEGLRNIAAADRLADIDLDVTQPEVDALRCTEANVARLHDTKVDAAKAACMPQRIDCVRSIQPIQKAQIGWDLERVSFAFYVTFESASKAAQSVASADSQGIISLAVPAAASVQKAYSSQEPLHRYLFDTIKAFREMYWCYYADAATGRLVGYKRLAAGEVSSDGAFLFTYGTPDGGMVFHMVDHQGVPGAEVARAAEWTLEARAWFQQGMNASDVAWTGLYSFAGDGGADNDIGLSHLRRVGEGAGGGVLGVDFFLHDVAHRFIDKVKVPRGNIFLVLNEAGQLISSNKVTGVVGGVPVPASEVAHPVVAAAAKHLANQYPSIGDPDGHPADRRALEQTVYTTWNHDAAVWNVALLGTGGQSGNTRSLRWTIVLLAPAPAGPLLSEEGCITRASCDAAVGGAVMQWRTSGINYITETVAFLFAHAKQALETVKVDMQVRAAGKEAKEGVKSAAYFLKKLRDFPALSFFHMVDLKEKRVYGWHRDGKAAAFNTISCDAAQKDCELINVYPVDEAGAVPAGAAPLETVATPWAWWNGAARTRPGHIVSFSRPFPLGDRLGRAFLYKDIGDPDVVFAVGVFEDSLSELLNGRNPDGTSVYLIDTSMLLLAATQNRAGVNYATSPRAPPAIRATAVGLQGLVTHLRDDSVQHADIPVQGGGGVYHVDYRRLRTERQEWDPGYYWVVVVVREGLQVMRTDNNRAPPEEDGAAGCVPCSSALAAEETRKQTLRDVTDAMNHYVGVASRSVLMMDAYFEVGFLEDDERIYHHLETQLNRSATLYWAGVYTKASVHTTTRFHGMYRTGPHTFVKFTQSGAANDTAWADAAQAAMLGAVLPDGAVWGWAGWRPLFGQDVLTAVRPVAERGEVKRVLAAGVRRDQLEEQIFTDAGGADLVVVDENEAVVFSTLPPGGDQDALREQFLAALPAYRSLAGKGMQAWQSKRVAHGDQRAFLSAVPFAHASPAWEALRPEAYNPAGLHWTVAMRTVERDTGCLGSAACQNGLRGVMDGLHERIARYAVEQLRFMGAKVKESANLEFSGLFRHVLEEDDQQSLYFVQRFLAHHVLLYPEVESFYVNVDNPKHGVTFIAVLPRPGAAAGTAAHPFAGYMFVTCEAAVCTAQALTKTGAPGAEIVLDAITTAESLAAKVSGDSVLHYALHSYRVNVTVGAGGLSKERFSEFLREIDVPADTLIYVTKPGYHNALASSRGVDSPLIAKSAVGLVDPVAGEDKAVPFKYADTDYICRYTLVEGLVVAVVQKRVMPGHVEMLEVDMNRDAVCAERGACEAQVDELLETSHRAKADSIELRMQQFMAKLDATVEALQYTIDEQQLHLSPAFAADNPVVQLLAAHVAEPRVTVLQFSQGAGAAAVSVVLDSGIIKWKNATGVYTARGIPPSEPLRKAGFPWRDVHEDRTLRWNLHPTTGALSVRRILSSGDAAVYVAAGEGVMVENVLDPFQGVVMDATHRSRLVANTVCQDVVEELERDVHQLNTVLASADVTKLRGCFIDLRPVYHKNSGLPLLVGSVERAPALSAHPTPAAAYGCVTWAACEVAANAAKLTLMDTTLQHVAAEFAMAERELVALRHTAFKAQLLASHHIQWVATVAYPFMGMMKSPTDPGVFHTLQCENKFDCMHIIAVDDDGKEIPGTSFAYPPLTEGVLTIGSGGVFYLRDGVAGGVLLQSLTSGVDQADSVEFEPVAHSTKNTAIGVISHAAVTPSATTLDAFVRVSDRVVLRSRQARSPVPHAIEERCHHSCERDIHRFRGGEVAAAAAAAAIGAAQDTAHAKLGVLGAFEVLPHILPEDPAAWEPVTGEGAIPVGGKTLCDVAEAHGVADTSVGHYDGSRVRLCRRANAPQNSTEEPAPPTYIEGVWTAGTAPQTRAWRQVGQQKWAPIPEYSEASPVAFLNATLWGEQEFWGVRGGGPGFVAVDATADLVRAADALSGDFGMAITLRRNGAVVLGDAIPSGAVVAEEDVRIAEPFGQQAMWAVAAWTTKQEELKPPAALGCFTDALCICEREKLHDGFTEQLLRAFGVVQDAAWHPLDALARAAQTHGALPRIAAVDGVAFAVHIDSDRRAYSGHAGGVPFHCTEAACTRDDTNAPFDAVPTFRMLWRALGVPGRAGRGYRLLDGAAGLVSLAGRPDGGWVGVGLTYDALRRGIDMILQAAPDGVGVLALNSRRHTIDINSALGAGNRNVEAVTVASVCTRTFRLHQYRNPKASELRGECGHEDRAYSLVARRFGDMLFAATIPRPSRPKSIPSMALVEHLRTALATTLPHSSSLYVVGKGEKRVVGVGHGGGQSFAAPHFLEANHLYTFGVLEKKARHNEFGGLWFEPQKPYYPFESMLPTLTAYLPVRRGGDVVAFLATGIELGDRLNAKFNALKKSWGAALPTTIRAVDPMHHVLAVSAEKHPNLGGQPLDMLTVPDTGLYSPAGPNLRQHPSGVVSGAMPMRYPLETTFGGGNVNEPAFTGGVLVLNATEGSLVTRACLARDICDGITQAQHEDALELVAKEAGWVFERALRRAAAAVRDLAAATKRHMPEVTTPRVAQLVQEQAAVHSIHGVLVQDTQHNTWGYTSLHGHTAVVECADGGTAGCTDLGVWTGGAAQPAALLRTPTMNTTSPQKYRLSQDMLGLGLEAESTFTSPPVEPLHVAGGVLLSEHTDGGVYVAAALAFGCVEWSWAALVERGSGAPLTLVLLDKDRRVLASATSGASVALRKGYYGLDVADVTMNADLTNPGVIQKMGMFVDAYVVDVSADFAPGDKVFAVAAMYRPQALPPPRDRTHALLEPYLPLFEAALADRPELHAVVATAGGVAVGAGQGYRFAANASGVQVSFTDGTPEPPFDPSWKFTPAYCFGVEDAGDDAGPVVGFNPDLKPLPPTPARMAGRGAAGAAKSKLPPFTPGLVYTTPLAPLPATLAGGAPPSGLCVVKAAARIEAALGSGAAKDPIGGLVAIGTVYKGGEVTKNAKKHPTVLATSADGSAEERVENGERLLASVFRKMEKEEVVTYEVAGRALRERVAEGPGANAYRILDTSVWPWAIVYYLTPTEVPQGIREMPISQSTSQAKVRAGAADLKAALEEARRAVAGVVDAHARGSPLADGALSRAVALHRGIRYAGFRVVNKFTGGTPTTFTGYTAAASVSPRDPLPTEASLLHHGCEAAVLSCPHPKTFVQLANGSRSEAEGDYPVPLYNPKGGWYALSTTLHARGVKRVADVGGLKLEVGIDLPHTPEDVLVLQVPTAGKATVVRTSFILSAHVRLLLENFDYTVSEGRVLQVRVNEDTQGLTFVHTPDAYGGYAVAHLVTHGRSFTADPPCYLDIPVVEFNERNEEFVRDVRAIVEADDKDILNDMDITAVAFDAPQNRVLVEITVATLQGWEGGPDGRRFQRIIAALLNITLPARWHQLEADEVVFVPPPTPPTPNPWSFIGNGGAKGVEHVQDSSATAGAVFAVVVVGALAGAGVYYYRTRTGTPRRRPGPRRPEDAHDDLDANNNIYAHNMHTMSTSRGVAVELDDDDSDFDHI